MKSAGIILLGTLLLIGCSSDKHQAHDHESQDGSVPSEASQSDQYVCPMHLEIVRNEPGTCPICGMDLVRVEHGQDDAQHVMLTDTQLRLANITTAPVTMQLVGRTTIINATLTVNEQQSGVISSRAAGRIEKLFIRETGCNVRQGEPLYTLYSEELLALEQEYLLAKEQYETLGDREKRYKSFLDAAKRKLILYGLTPRQIEALQKDNLRPQIVFFAPQSGTVYQVTVTEGEYVAEGTPLFRIEGTSSLWVEADLYPGEHALVQIGDTVTVTTEGGRTTKAAVTFLGPEFKTNTQITVLRARISNPDGTLRPGQFAQVHLIHSTREALALPPEAVIRDEHGAHVYLATSGHAFRPQMVKTGLEGPDLVEVTEGLIEGDTVAVTGAYLLYAEFALKKGGDPMAGHSH